MTAAGGLEGAYRRLLRWYPPVYRRRHEEEILGVLMATAQPGQRRPGARESLDLMWSALKIRIRTAVRGAGSQPWVAALTLVGVLLPLLMVAMKLTLFLDRGARYGFGSPADLLVGAYGEPGSFAGSFRLNPYSVALTSNITDALTAGPVPSLILSGLVLLGWRRVAAAFAGLIPLAYLVISFTNNYTLLAVPRVDVTLYAYGLEALVLLAASGAVGHLSGQESTAPGWRALRWRPSALLATATVAAGIGMSGGLWPLFHSRPSAAIFSRELLRAHRLRAPSGFVDRLFGIGTGGWGGWLLWQGTLVAVIVVTLAIMLVSSSANLRTVALFAIPFALGAVVYLCSLVSPPPGPVGNTLIAIPLLLFLLAVMALRVGYKHPDGPAAPSQPPAPGSA